MMMRPPEPESVKVKKDRDEDTNEHNNNALLEDAELESVEDYVEKVVFVRTKKVGYLIGTAGRTIRGFENNSGAKIDIMTPNSRNQETPVLLSGTAESVKNVLRMVTDLYHMNNFSSQLWQHIRNNAVNTEPLDENGDEKIYAHEEIMVPRDFLSKCPKLIFTLESEIGVHVDIGREIEEFPGQVPLGVIGTAVENVNAMEMINDSLMNFRDQHSPSSTESTPSPPPRYSGTTLRYEDLQDQKRSEREDGKSVFKDDDSEDDEDVVELSKGNENWEKLMSGTSPPSYKRRRSSESEVIRHYRGSPRLDPFSSHSKPYHYSNRYSHSHRYSMSGLMALQSFSEKIILPLSSHVDSIVLQPICKLNNVMLEKKERSDGYEIMISGTENNVKRAKLQLLYNYDHH